MRARLELCIRSQLPVSEGNRVYRNCIGLAKCASVRLSIKPLFLTFWLSLVVHRPELAGPNKSCPCPRLPFLHALLLA